MAKSLEQKLIDAVKLNGGHSSFNPVEFGRLLSYEDLVTQQAFYSSMVAFITYKGVSASQYSNLDKDTIAGICLYLKGCLERYFPEVRTEEPNPILY